ncbi:hypothetical protein K491DRAFT_626527 [Lophiostoma macrostomum CBS 122681]|uniref:Peptidase S54 rhomboid domain-containing protein n=1 Tax=Lophiostoma macrostomum CBS 122681 TaxID=1314788 RepID=A0A6A6TE53_9PLEO|nr:hypothetical protein K491DRAFT_626527 [Lophiostoma macrostomum CBS 122681]
MSNALPMALLRPSCAALRSAPVSLQWNTVTRAFARQFCSQKTRLEAVSRPSILSVVQSRKPRTSHLQARSFSLTARTTAQVSDPPEQPGFRGLQRREVRIGPLPNGQAEQRTIRGLFGPDVSTQTGNEILRILHHRRTSGSLADYGVDNLGERYRKVTRQAAVKALEWLRDEYPVDEARAAEEWAEKEANRIAYNMWLADPENADSKYNDPARVWREQQDKKKKEEEEQQEERRIGILRVGPSQFERNIEQKRKERLAEITRKAEEKEQKEKEDEAKLATGEYVRTPGGTALMKPGQTAYVDIFGREQVSQRKEMLEMYQKKANTPFKDEAEMLTHTTLAQRLYPMTAFVFIVCLLSWGFGHYYIPPAPAYRLIPDVSLTTATIVTIMGINILVCAAWRWGPLWPLMTRYFMHVPGYPRAIQAVGNVFSHVQYEHLLGNLWIFALAGTACHELVDRGIFLGTYFSAGAVGTLFTLYWANIGRGVISAHSVGASAAIWGISTLYLLLTDTEKIKIPFTSGEGITFWPKMLLLAFVAFEVRMAWSGRAKTMDHASHFGGIFVGASVAGYLRATGWNERSRAGQNAPVLDPAKMIKEEAEQVTESVKSIVTEK